MQAWKVPVLLVLAMNAPAQDASPDRWRGLKLDEATPEQAIQLLGKPASDKAERVDAPPIDRWFTPDLKRLKFRTLGYKEIEGFGNVNLYFHEETLAVVVLQVKAEIQPTALANIYGLEFRPYMTGFQESLAVVERHEGKIYPKQFPMMYSLVAVSRTSVVNALIRNAGLGTAFARALGSGIDTAGGGFPGRVAGIQLISRRLENRAGAELLK